MRKDIHQIKRSSHSLIKSIRPVKVWFLFLIKEKRQEYVRVVVDQLWFFDLRYKNIKEL